MAEGPSIYLTRGIPGSGKTTWARNAALEWGAVRVSRDDIRYQMYGVYHGGRIDEDLVTQVETQMVLVALEGGQDVIVDAMHLEQRYINRWQKLGYPVHLQEFPVPLGTALRQNVDRSKMVPERVIEDLFRRFAKDDLGTLKSVKIQPEKYISHYKYRPETNLPAAYIFDLDGTLAHNDGHRSFYDYSKVFWDKVHPHVQEVAIALNEGFHVIIVTGRKPEAVEDSKLWLTNNYIKFDEFFSRAEGDDRPDSIVKMEILERDIAPNYNVLGVFDDRPQVVRAWERAGLPVFKLGNQRKEF